MSTQAITALETAELKIVAELPNDSMVVATNFGLAFRTTQGLTRGFARRISACCWADLTYSLGEEARIGRHRAYPTHCKNCLSSTPPQSVASKDSDYLLPQHMAGLPKDFNVWLEAGASETFDPLAAQLVALEMAHRLRQLQWSIHHWRTVENVESYSELSMESHRRIGHCLEELSSLLFCH